MTAAATQKKAPAGLSNKAREMMEAINADAGKHNIWVRTQANAPAQRPWFSETSGEGSGQLASGRVAANQMKTLPHMWQWKDFSPYLHRISEIARKADISPIEFADRQSILLLNPGLNGRLQVTNTIRCAISIYNPGDVAPVHLHSPNASRTILSEKGGYTVVEGERCDAARGDLILTPNGTWHDHGNDASEPVIWIDMLDWPLMEFLDAAWVDHDYARRTRQRPGAADHTQRRLFAPALWPRRDAANLRQPPAWGRPQSGSAHPLSRRRRARDAAQPAQGKGRSARGHQDRLRQPGDGRAGVQDAQLFRPAPAPGEETELKRETAGTFYVVIEGTGATEVGGKRLEWTQNDIFVAPNFLWRRHINTGKNDAVIYSVSDAALMRNIGQYYAQGRSRTAR